MNVVTETRKRKIGEVISKGNSSYCHVDSPELQSHTLTYDEMTEMNLVADNGDNLYELTEFKVCIDCNSEALYDRKAEEWYCQFCNDD